MWLSGDMRASRNTRMLWRVPRADLGKRRVGPSPRKVGGHSSAQNSPGWDGSEFIWPYDYAKWIFDARIAKSWKVETPSGGAAAQLHDNPELAFEDMRPQSGDRLPRDWASIPHRRRQDRRWSQSSKARSWADGRIAPTWMRCRSTRRPDVVRLETAGEDACLRPHVHTVSPLGVAAALTELRSELAGE